MRPGVKTIAKPVKLMRDPNPRFVSIVNHGANQTPWQVVKLANLEGAKGMGIKRRVKGKKAVSKSSSLPGAVARVEFEKSEFGTKKDVKKWLKENSWEDYVIKDSDGIFIAASTITTKSDFTGNLRSVTIEEGVTGYVGRLKNSKAADVAEDEDEDDEDEDENEADEAKSAFEKILIAKFDGWSAYFSDGESIQDVMSDAMKDGLPPGFDEVMFAVSKALANTLKGGDSAEKLKTKLNTIGSEMTDLVFNMHTVFQEFLDDDDSEEEETKAAETFFAEVEAAAKAEGKSNHKPKKPGKKKAKKVKKELLISDDEPDYGDDEDEGEDSGLDTSALKAMFGKISTKLDSISKSANEASESAEKALKNSNRTAKKLEELESITPEQRGEHEDAPADDDDDDNDAEAKRAFDEFRSNLGVYS